MLPTEGDEALVDEPTPASHRRRLGPPPHGYARRRGLPGRAERPTTSIWHNGALVDDVTTAPGFANAARTIAAYYDFQCDPANRDLVSYEDEDGQRSHRSFKMPRSKQDLRDRGAAFAAWAEHTGGQLGRAPDYMNAAIAGVAAAEHHWGQQNPELGEHAVGILEHCRRNDVCLTHTFVTPQIDRKDAARRAGTLPQRRHRQADLRRRHRPRVEGARYVGAVFG